jgi:hypothetical protein
MIKREDFIFTVGYQGETAIVNGELKSGYGKLNSIEFAEKGFFKSAICSALYEKNSGDLEKILDIYNSKVEKKLNTVDDLKKTFGVTDVPEGIARVSII